MVNVVHERSFESERLLQKLEWEKMKETILNQLLSQKIMKQTSKTKPNLWRAVVNIQ